MATATATKKTTKKVIKGKNAPTTGDLIKGEGKGEQKNITGNGNVGKTPPLDLVKAASYSVKCREQTSYWDNKKKEADIETLRLLKKFKVPSVRSQGEHFSYLFKIDVTEKLKAEKEKDQE